MFQRYGLSFWPCSSCAEGLTCGQGPQCYLFRKWNIFDARSLYKSSQVMKCGRVLWTPSRFFQERLVSKGNGFIEVLEISLCSHTSLSIRLVLTVGPPLRRAYRRRSKWQIGKTLQKFCYNIVRASCTLSDANWPPVCSLCGEGRTLSKWHLHVRFID